MLRPTQELEPPENPGRFNKEQPDGYVFNHGTLVTRPLYFPEPNRVLRSIRTCGMAALVAFGLTNCAAPSVAGQEIRPYPTSVASIRPAICGAAGASVVTDTGLKILYSGKVPNRPKLCRISINDVAGDYYFGIWDTKWPGGAKAEQALQTVIFGSPGTMVRFDTIGGPGYPYFKFHETIRNEGFERLHVAGRYYNTMKIAHERQGFGGNIYHSVVTQWRDIRTGVTVYVNYQHISGWPQPRAWSPLKIMMRPCNSQAS